MRVLTLSIVLFATGCASLRMGDSWVWVRGDVKNAPADSKCQLKLLNEDGSVRTSRPIQPVFDVSLGIRPGAGRYSFEVACGTAKYRSKVYELDATKKVDLGGVVLID